MKNHKTNNQWDSTQMLSELIKTKLYLGNRTKGTISKFRDFFQRRKKVLARELQFPLHKLKAAFF